MQMIRILVFRATPETRLREDFAGIVAELNIQDLLVPFPEPQRTLPPEEFGLVPILSAHPKGRRIIDYSGRDVKVPEGVVMTYPNDADFDPTSNGNCYPSGAPYIDTGRAIGLTHASESGPHLIAVAAAGIEENTLVVTQIQDVTGMTRATHGRAIFRNALRGGYYWRDTLVRSWEQVARTIGTGRIAVRSCSNSRWPEARSDGYDAVAKRLGFSQNLDSQDWVKVVEQHPS